MKCNNCNIVIDNKFEHAIRLNNCPACGKYIMPPEKLAVYMSLQELIKSNFSDVDAEKVSNLVIANFELKQLFKDSKPKSEKIDSKREVSETETIEVSEDEISDKEYDEIHKAKQLNESRVQLKKMKEEAYENALKDQYGMGDIDDEVGDASNADGFFGKDMETTEVADRMKGAQKQSTSQNKMLSGTGGFSRTDA